MQPITITFTDLLVWLIVALLVGILGELIAGRRVPDGILGAMLLGFLGIFLVVGVLHFSIDGEPRLGGVPIVSSVIGAVILVIIWSGFAYHRMRYRR